MMRKSNGFGSITGLFLLIAALILPSLAAADVIFVSGDVSGVWSADSVIVADSIYVSPGNTLEIEPGVHVLFLTANYFRVLQGAVLYAVGTETDTIKFLPAVEGYNTLGIDFEDAADESIMEYCYFRRALYSALTLNHCNMAIRNCYFEDNHGYYRGGAITTADSSDALIENNVIRNNDATGQGGGIYCNDSSPTIRGNIIDGNGVGPGAIGGGISCNNHSHPLIVNNTFTNNRVSPQSGFPATQGQGGAIYCSNLSNPVITGNLFYNNRVNAGGAAGQNGGGAIFVFAAAPVIANNVFAGNEAHSGNGGALYLFIYNSSLVNNVFVDNMAVSYGGAIYMDLSNPSVTNSILYTNTAPDGPIFYLDRSSTVEVSYSDIDGGWDGAGNIDTDPLFRDPPSQDYQLMAIECGDNEDSPCIDAGDPGIQDSLLDCSWGLGNLRSDMGAFAGGDSVLVGISDLPGQFPDKFSLSQNYPNPFNASTSIEYSLPERAAVTIEIYNILGRKVETIQNGSQSAGYHRIAWKGNDLVSGAYFYRLRAGDFTETRKMMLLK